MLLLCTSPACAAVVVLLLPCGGHAQWRLACSCMKLHCCILMAIDAASQLNRAETVTIERWQCQVVKQSFSL